MDEFRQNNRLRGALDAALSGLNGDPALAQRVLRCAEEKPRAAKKLSVSLVFALIALLAATGIAAAALKSRLKPPSARNLPSLKPRKQALSPRPSPTPITTANRCSSATQFKAFRALSLFRRRMNSWRGCARPTLFLRG